MICASSCGRPQSKTGDPSHGFALNVQEGTVRPFTGQPQATRIWGYNGKVAGPTLRMKVGEKFKLRFNNQGKQPTSIHWHGLRIANDMDGVGTITQPGTKPGETFDYDFTPPDAGLFWYHPHVNSEKQIAKGMFGAIVIEENNPPPVDQEVVWTLFDWGLTDEYQVPEGKAFQLWRGFEIYEKHRLITTNGISAPPLKIINGERLRLRIANTSGNRRYALKFEGHAPWIIAWDGNAVDPYQLKDGPLFIGNGARVDLIIDGNGIAGQSYKIVDVFDQVYDEAAAAFPVTTIDYEDSTAMRPQSALPPISAPVLNHIPEPDLKNAIPFDIVLDQALYEISDIPKIGAAAEVIAAMHGVPANTKVPVWSMNNKVLFEDLNDFICIDPEPLFQCKLGKTYLLRYTNKTPTDHPMHLHGHTFLMVSKNGKPYPRQMYRDTFMIMKDDVVEVAFVADNVGEWMMHCHRGLHLHGGMMTTFTVS